MQATQFFKTTLLLGFYVASSYFLDIYGQPILFLKGTWCVDIIVDSVEQVKRTEMPIDVYNARSKNVKYLPSWRQAFVILPSSLIAFRILLLQLP